MKNKKAVLFITMFIVLGLVFDLSRGFYEYFDIVKAVEAGGGCPKSEGGSVTKFTQICQLDSDYVSAVPTQCRVSCPMVTNEYATFCAGYMEMQVSSQMGTTMIAPTTGFQFKGKSMPAAGDQFLACLAGGSIPLVIGLPSSTAMRAKKLVDFYDKYIVAIFK